jgi:hypothetical protein
MLQKKELRNGLLLLSFIVFTFTQCTHVKNIYSSYKKDIVERDSPVPVFEKGLNNWVMNQYSQAEIDFNNAKAIDSTYAPAISGLALIAATKGNNDEALKLAEMAKGMNSKDPYVFIVKALVLETINLKNGSPGAWLSEAKQEYSQAISLNEKSPEPYFHRAHMYKKLFQLSEATADFQKIVDLGTRHVSKAQFQLSLIESIQEASPESEIGRKIALSDKVTFHEIGQLLETETVGAKTSVSEPPPAMVSDSGTDSTDISLNINESTITQRGTTLRNLTEASLNSRNTITRGEFAIIVEEMIIGITGDTYLKNRYKGASRSRFLDVPASHPAYSSICTTIEKKIMQLKEKQLFGPDKPLTGPDALLITKKLKNMGKM